jgi:hypothetical protein
MFKFKIIASLLISVFLIQCEPKSNCENTSVCPPPIIDSKLTILKQLEGKSYIYRNGSGLFNDVYKVEYGPVEIKNNQKTSYNGSVPDGEMFCENVCFHTATQKINFKKFRNENDIDFINLIVDEFNIYSQVFVSDFDPLVHFKVYQSSLPSLGRQWKVTDVSEGVLISNFIADTVETFDFDENSNIIYDFSFFKVSTKRASEKINIQSYSLDKGINVFYDESSGYSK